MSIIQTAKEVVEVVQKADNIGLLRQLLVLQTEINEMADENRNLKDEVRRLRETEDIKKWLRYDGKRYWLERPDHEPDGPFCQRCFDVDKVLVREREGATPKLTYCCECALKGARGRS